MQRSMTAQELKDAYAAGERDFREIQLLREGLGRANLYAANLGHANLEDANLYAANLEDANLYAANLYAANLYAANLEGANLYAANLGHANLEDANLEDARLPGAWVLGMSSRNDALVPIYRRKGLLINTGCFTGTPDEFRAQVQKSHGDNIHAQLYLAQLAVFELSWKHWRDSLPAEAIDPAAASEAQSDG